MSISVLENKWTEEEFRTEISKIQRSMSEYDFDWKNKKFGEKIEDYMLIYQKLGHRKSCSSLTFLGTLNLPPIALSLNGKLGLAFGARGRGGKNTPLPIMNPQK